MLQPCLRFSLPSLLDHRSPEGAKVGMSHPSVRPVYLLGDAPIEDDRGNSRRPGLHRRRKRGELADIVRSRRSKAILTQLLDGTRRDSDPSHQRVISHHQDVLIVFS